jgi:hypothetical protein
LCVKWITLRRAQFELLSVDRDVRVGSNHDLVGVSRRVRSSPDTRRMSPRRDCANDTGLKPVGDKIGPRVLVGVAMPNRASRNVMPAGMVGGISCPPLFLYRHLLLRTLASTLAGASAGSFF